MMFKWGKSANNMAYKDSAFQDTGFKTLVLRHSHYGFIFLINIYTVELLFQ